MLASDQRKSIMRVRTLSDSLTLSIRRENQRSNHFKRRTCSDGDIAHMNVLDRPSVGFKHVNIREYGVVLGDNPSCSGGAPLSLDWRYSESIKNLPIETYEEYRDGNRRQQAELKIPARVRADILLDKWDCTLSSILRATKEVNAVREGRIETTKKAMKDVRRQEKIESAMKPLKSALKKLRRNRSSRSLQKEYDIDTYYTDEIDEEEDALSEDFMPVSSIKVSSH